MAFTRRASSEGTGGEVERREVKGRHSQRQGEVGGGGKAQAATGRGARKREGIGSDRERWEAEGRYRQRQGEVGGGGEA